MDTRQKIEAAVAAVAAASADDEYRVAEQVLTTQTSDVLYTLATAALVDAARSRRRSAVLVVERESERTRARTTANRAVAEQMQDEHFAKMVGSLTRIVDDYAASLKIEWTAELLGSEFALPDGSRTTWGEATVGQHRDRVAMFTANAQANLEGAARHEKAIAELVASGAHTLSDLLMGVAS